MRARWQALFCARLLRKCLFSKGFLRTGLASVRSGGDGRAFRGRGGAAILGAKSALSTCSVSAKGLSPAADGGPLGAHRGAFVHRVIRRE